MTCKTKIRFPPRSTVYEFREKSDNDGNPSTVVNDQVWDSVVESLKALTKDRSKVIRHLSGDSLSTFNRIVQHVRILYGGAHYSRLYSEIRKAFPLIEGVQDQPGTVGAYFTACFDQPGDACKEECVMGQAAPSDSLQKCQFPIYTVDEAGQLKKINTTEGDMAYVLIAPGTKMTEEHVKQLQEQGVSGVIAKSLIREREHSPVFPRSPPTSSNNNMLWIVIVILLIVIGVCALYLRNKN